jgi:hypothetical protein
MSTECDACVIERIGCPCDGALDAGCFRCTPEKHARPECPPSCPNHVRAKIRSAVESGNVSMSGNAGASVEAMLADPHPREKTEQETVYHEIVRTAVVKDGHRQMPPTDAVVEHKGVRLYMVTTIASQPRYGGTRTVVMCSSFERAKEIVERNEGDIFECSYSLAVIEATVADWLYGGCLQEQYWYVWKGDSRDGAYVPIEQPEAYANVFNIGGVG